ncbi:MAG: hypothetical protein JSS47_22025, partial [Proteobacteria bacterium]|nr:hypothetical protein [Pseudomonadota bacterium]
MNTRLSAAALPDSPRSPLRQRIDAAWRTPEAECVPHLVEAARLDERLQAKARDMARKLVVGLRTTRARSSGVD